MKSEIDYLVSLFGEYNEIIDENLLDNIIDEISAILEENDNDDKHEISEELVLASIELGKPQILEYLLENNDYSKETTSEFKKHIEDYVKSGEDEDEEHYGQVPEIIIMFEKLINDYEDPKKKKWIPGK
jgi:hypothetical protein